MTKFKVGDRVRYDGGSCNAAKAGATAVVERHEGELVHVRWIRDGLDCGQFDGGYFPRNFELVAATPAAATLTVEAGKFYKTRDGRKVGPMDEWRYGAFRENEGDGRFWHTNGEGQVGASGEDLVAECVDEPVVAHKFKVGDVVKHKTLGYVGTIKDVLGGGRYRTYWPCQGWGGNDSGEDIEPAAVAPATAAEPEEPAPYTAPAVGDDVLIPGWITAINHSRKGTVYSIAFETRNRRVSLNFTEEDFIPVDPDDECPCFAENDNGPLPLAPNTAAAFDDLCGSIFGLTMRAA